MSKIPKIDLKKVGEVEKDSERVIKIVWSWANKSLNDPDLPWETAMTNAANELGLNRAELSALIAGNEPFKDLVYGLGIYENWRRAKFEMDQVRKEFGWDKKKVKSC